jgi:hypothetical protein
MSKSAPPSSSAFNSSGVTRERVLCAAHAVVRLQRDAAEEPEDAEAAPPPDLEPQNVGQHRGAEGDEERGGEAQLAGARERARRDDERRRGQRESELLRQDGGEEHEVAVTDEELKRVSHAALNL